MADDRAGPEVPREVNHRNAVELVLDDVERLPSSRSPSPFIASPPVSSIRSATPVFGSILKSDAVLLWTAISHFSLADATIPFRLKPGWCT